MAPAITLSGNGRLVASKVESVSDMPARVLLDFEGVAMGSVPSNTAINQGDVQRVRVGLNSREPFITRVVIDLARKIPYTVETVGEELRVMFARAADAAASMVATATPAAATPLLRLRPRLRRRRRRLVKRLRSVTNADASPVVTPPPARAGDGCSAPVAAQAPTAAATIAAIAQTAGASQPTTVQPPVPAGTGGAAIHRPSGHLRLPGRRPARGASHLAEISGLNLVIDQAVQGTVERR